MTQITENIYLGAVDDATNKEFLREHDIDIILNFAKECDYDNCNSRIFKVHIGFNDDYTTNILNYFDIVGDIILTNIKQNKKILLHCAVGRSRSASFILAYLVREHKMDLHNAFKFVKDKRDIFPNISFMEQLIKYETHLLKTPSTFNMDSYIIDFIQETTKADRDKISKIYFESNKNCDITLDKLFM